MAGTQTIIPYFEALFSRLEGREPETSAAFGRHVHWGYWSEPARADGTPEDYGRAAELMCRRVCDAAGAGDNQRILDVGCGFGGTIASLNERFSGVRLAGVNIDRRQLNRAEAIRPRSRNAVEFVEADAMDLPFEDASFDVVLAVECIFHFPERERFFAEAARVLRPGGVLTVSDFVPSAEAQSLLLSYDPRKDDAMLATYGCLNIHCSSADYHELGRLTGLMLTKEEDISVHTMPTYSFLRNHFRRLNDDYCAIYEKATSQLEKTCRKGWVRYTILTFRKQAGSFIGAA